MHAKRAATTTIDHKLHQKEYKIPYILYDTWSKFYSSPQTWPLSKSYCPDDETRELHKLTVINA